MTVATTILVVLGFLLGGLVGGYIGWSLRARRDGDSEAPSSSRTLKIVVVTALSTLLFASAAGYATVRIMFRAKPMKTATVDQAVADFRSNNGAAVNADDSLPAAGVYSFQASGSSDIEIPLLGKEHRDLPAEVPAVLVRDGDCWDLTIRFFEEHRWTSRYCRPQATLHHPGSETVNVHFGRTVNASVACTPDELVRADMSPGDSWTQSCAPENDSGMGGPDTMEATLTFVGIEEVKVGGDVVDAHHIKREITMTGTQAGTTTRDYWYAESGLLVRFRHRSQTSGIGTVVQAYDITLTGLTPAS